MLLILFFVSLFCEHLSGDGDNLDNVYDGNLDYSLFSWNLTLECAEIFKLLEEKEMLEQQLENLEKSPKSSDESCSRDQQKLRLLSGVVESRREEVTRLKREVREREGDARQRELECSVDNMDESEAVKDTVKFRGRYTFPVEVVERARVDSPLVLEHLKDRVQN